MADDLAQLAHPAVTSLMSLDEQQLFSELGARVNAVSADPAKGGNFALEVSTESASPFESAIDFSVVGRRFFDNLNLAAYNVVCGKGEGSADVTKLLGQGTSALAAGVASVLVSQLGLAAAVAAAVATLIVKLFFDAGTKTLCQTWSEHLPQAAAQQPAAQPPAAQPPAAVGNA